MKLWCIKLLVLVMFIGGMPLRAVQDENEWSMEKHRLIGTGLCVISVVLFIAIQTGKFFTDYQENGEWFCDASTGVIDSLHAGTGLAAFQGLWFSFKGYTGSGIDSEDEGAVKSAEKRG